MGAAFRIVLVMALLTGTGWSQFLPPLEADTPEEFDDYLTVEAATGPKAVLAATQAFRQRWPKSAMLPRVYELEFEAWRQSGDLARARSAAEAALALAPANLQIKSELAALVAGLDPAYAEQLAREALTGLEGFRVPKRITPEVWQRLSGRIRSQAHMALGVVAFGRGDVRTAVEELESADQAAPALDAALALRLARIYAAVGRKTDSEKQLERVLESGDAAAIPIARQELEKLKSQGK